jgi:hypothetical protein
MDEPTTLYAWYIWLPGGGPPHPKVVRSKEEAALLVAEALQEAPDNALGVIAKTELGVALPMHGIMQVVEIGYAEDFTNRPRGTDPHQSRVIPIRP